MITLCFYEGFYLPSCCHFPEIGHLTSDVELTKDIIVAVISFLSDTMWGEVLIHSTWIPYLSFKRSTILTRDHCSSRMRFLLDM